MNNDHEKLQKYNEAKAFVKVCLIYNVMNRILFVS